MTCISTRIGKQVPNGWFEYDISMKTDDTLWITNSDGEGGEFSGEDFFNVVDKFFKDRF